MVPSDVTCNHVAASTDVVIEHMHPLQPGQQGVRTAKRVGFPFGVTGSRVTGSKKPRRRLSAIVRERPKPIHVIARECGYSSSWILSRTLKRDAGMTPTTYRRERQ